MHVDPLPLGAYPWYLRPWRWWRRRRRGTLPEGTRVWARLPRLYLATGLLQRVLERRRGAVEPALRALAGLRVAQLTESVWGVDHYGRVLRDEGAAWEKIRKVGQWPETECFGSRERAVLAYAEAMTDSATPVSADIMGSVKRHLDDEALIELTGVIAYQNMTARFHHALDIPPQGLCSVGVDERGEAVAVDEGPAAR